MKTFFRLERNGGFIQSSFAYYSYSAIKFSFHYSLQYYYKTLKKKKKRKKKKKKKKKGKILIKKMKRVIRMLMMKNLIYVSCTNYANESALFTG
jgi:hypothetical protein